MSEWLILFFVLYIIYLIMKMKKPKATTEKPAPKAKVDQTTATATAPVVTTKEAPKKSKPSSNQVTRQKAQAVTPKPVISTPEITMPERIGLTAGSVWHYLAENGAASVSKLVRELPEEEKVVHRSIGWLAQEGKISLYTVDRVETIALKE